MPIKSLEKPDQKLLGKRGEGTRYALLMAGLELFGEYGVKATSTRMLAESSGTNVAAIPYYFGSKEGLYKAVVGYIVERMRAHIGEPGREAQQMMEAGKISKKQARGALQQLMAAFAGVFVESDEPKAWVRIVMREQSQPTEAFDILYYGQMQRVQKILARLVAVVVDLDPEGDEAKLRAHALFSQILGFLIAREGLLRQLGSKTLQEKHVGMIYRVLSMHIDACLKAPALSEEEP